jgi:serine/threonine-protein kinase
MAVGSLLGGRYELQASLGEGGFGTVWRAHDRVLSRDVAVKLISFGQQMLFERDEMHRRFVREAQAVAALNHPNVVTAHDFGVAGDTAYLVMELIAGQSLEDELAERRRGDRGALDIAAAVAVGIQISSGLAAAHAAGLVHRDLKPANVMRTSAERIKIVDFGIARDAQQSRLTQSGVYLGTLRYTSPEQMDGDAVDGRSDLYSLGCLLFELLTGRSPFDAQSPSQWVAAHHGVPPRPLSEFRPDAPSDLVTLIRELLAKSPGDRPASADIVRERLERIQSTVMNRPGPAPSGQPGWATPAPTGWAAPAQKGWAAPVQGAPIHGAPIQGAPVQGGPVQGGPVQGGPVQGPTMPGGPMPTSPGWGAPSWPQQPQYPAPGYPSGYGYGASPYLPYGMPAGPVPRPATVVVASALLALTALLSVSIGVGVLLAHNTISDAWHTAFDPIVRAGAASDIGYGYAMVTIGVVLQASLALGFAYGLYRGSRAVRVLTWIYVGLTMLCCILTFDVPELFTPTSDEITASHAVALDHANTVFANAFPTWLTTLSAVVGVVGALSLVVCAVLVAVPPSGRFFRAGRMIR